MANTGATNPQPQPTGEIIRGNVKKVNSADTLVMCVFGPDRTPSDVVVHLANLVAPKVAVYTSDMNQRDDPLGWECREILRKELVGTAVTAEIEHRAAKSVFAYVYKGNALEGESLNEMAVSRGLASVKDVSKKNERYDKLKELQEQAKNAKRGIWADDKATKEGRKIVWAADDVSQLLDSYKGVPLDAVVESIHPGAAGVRVFVKLEDGVFYYLTIMLSGIRGPSDESRLKPRAIYFIEAGLLHQDVKIILDGAGNNGQLFGRVVHPQYDIVKELVANGLAHAQDWSLAAMEQGYANELREAEKTAKQKRAGIWKDYKEPVKAAPIVNGVATAKVVEVVAADILVVKDATNNLRKIFLSSIRPPRKEATKEPQGKLTMAQRMFQQPLLFQAREFLRTRLIGKNVVVQTDYIQPKSDQFPEKTCCTVLVNGKNIAEQLVSAGLASVIRYRQDNDQRSPHYVDLQAAEMTAQKNGVGLFAKKEPESMKVVDLQGDVIKSKQYFTSIQRSNPNSAIVEFVSSGSRLRVYCAKHACVFTLLLNGIQCPRSSRPELGGQAAQGGDPFGDEALKFTRDLCLQHDITIDLEGQDKNGAMIGKAMVNGKNISVELVKAGLASVHHSADKTNYFKDLSQAEEQAKEKKLRLWENYVEQVEEEAKEAVEEPQEDVKSERKIELKTVEISEITPAVSKFYVQYSADQAKYKEMHAKLQEELKNPSISGTFKRGERAAAKFSDGDWYRVKIEKITPVKAELLYIDFGNRSECKPSELQQLPAFCATKPDFAHLVNLAFVKMPTDEDKLLDARRAFEKDLSVKGDIKMNVEYTIQGENYVTLHVGDSDIGRGLVADGLMFFEPRKGQRYAKICNDYEKAQQKAKSEHLNLWEYGDPRGDEDDRN